MQSIAPITTDQLLQPGKQPLLKFEIHDGCCWVDLTSYVVAGSLSISTAGAEMTPAPVAGEWSISLFNKNGRFDPDVDTYAPDNEYLKIGRKVKISIGAKYNGTDYYWRRIYGFMELPDFSIDKCSVDLSGFDNMQFLTDTKLKEPDNYWGSFATFDSKSSEGTLGGELYDEFDAMEIEHEDDNVDEWTPTNCAFISQADAGAPSGTHVGQMTMTAPADFASVKNPNVINANVTAGKKYKVAFEYKRLAGSSIAVGIYQTVGGADRICGQIYGLSENVYTEASFYFTALKTGVIEMWIAYADLTNGQFRIDKISIKEQIDPEWYRYEMPEACMGIHYVELNEGEGFLPVWPGKQKGEGWYYDPTPKYFYFDEDKDIDAGTANLKIHYYTVQIPENIVAVLLARAGLYDNQAEALAAMIYTATSITIDKVWFDAGSTCLNAVKMLCERCNYRFYFNYGQRPVFKPTPTPKVPGLEDFSFLESKVTGIRDFEDRSEIRNRIIILGNEQALPEGAEETKPSKFKGEALEVASINKYGEHTMSITNHLFQDQATIDAYVAIYLATFKDPKWYTTYDTPFNPAPLEKGDTLHWRKKYEAGGTPIDQRGLLRDIQINEHVVSYTIEKVTNPPVLWLPFDEGEGIIAYDKSGNENHGMLYPTPVLISACETDDDWSGESLSIDNVDFKEGVGSLKDTVALPVADTAYTTKYNPGGTWDWSGNKHILFELKSNRARAAFASATLYIYDTLANWRYWLLTFSAGEWTTVKKLLSTGDGESGVPPNLALINDIRVSFTTADDTPFYKKLDFVRIDDRAVWVPGIINTALKHDGVDDKVNCGHDAGLDITEAITVTACVKLEEYATTKFIVHKYKNAANGTWYLSLSGSVPYNKLRFVFIDEDGGFQPKESDIIIPLNEKTFVGATYDGKTTKLFINDVMAGEGSYIGKPMMSNPTQDLEISSSLRPLNSIIDEVRVYEGAFTVNEMKVLYNTLGI